MSMPTISRPSHPLVEYIRNQKREQDAAVERWLPAAHYVLGHHFEHGTDDQSVYHIDGIEPSQWTYIGPAAHDNVRVLLSHGPNYVAVSERDTPRQIAWQVAPPPPAGLARARALMDAAIKASPIVEVTLASSIHFGTLAWESDETIAAAAQRVAYDAAWQLHPQANPAIPRAADVYTAVTRGLGLPWHGTPEQAKPHTHIRAYLETRGGIWRSLKRLGITWGGEELTAGQVAERLGIAVSAWRSYITRGEAPTADTDVPTRWRLATIDAWNLIRPRIEHLDW